MTNTKLKQFIKIISIIVLVCFVPTQCGYALAPKAYSSRLPTTASSQISFNEREFLDELIAMVEGSRNGMHAPARCAEKIEAALRDDVPAGSPLREILTGLPLHILAHPGREQPWQRLEIQDVDVQQLAHQARSTSVYKRTGLNNPNPENEIDTLYRALQGVRDVWENANAQAQRPPGTDIRTTIAEVKQKRRMAFEAGLSMDRQRAATGGTEANAYYPANRWQKIAILVGFSVFIAPILVMIIGPFLRFAFDIDLSPIYPYMKWIIITSYLTAQIVLFHRVSLFIYGGITPGKIGDAIRERRNFPKPFRATENELGAWREQKSDQELPMFTVLLPVYDEENVINLLLRNMTNMNYPKDKYEVLILGEEKDRATLDKVNQAIADGTLPSIFHTVTSPARITPEMAQTKPYSCNLALDAAGEIATGDYAVIWDAEDRPHPDQLALVAWSYDQIETTLDNLVAVMGPDGRINSLPDLWRRAHEYGIDLKLGERLYRQGYRGDDLIKEFKDKSTPATMQAKLTWFNWPRNWITKLFKADYDSHFQLGLPGMVAMGVPIPLGGTSNYFRIDVLKELGGWDPFNVTEDADLGIRIYAAGYSTGMIDANTAEEAVMDVVSWINQRSRWVKGFIQTYLAHTKNPFKLLKQLGLRQWLHFHPLVAGSPLGSLIYLQMIVFTFSWVAGALGLMIFSTAGGPLFDFSWFVTDYIQQLFSWIPGEGWAGLATGLAMLASPPLIMTYFMRRAVVIPGPDDNWLLKVTVDELRNTDPDLAQQVEAGGVRGMKAVLGRAALGAYLYLVNHIPALIKGGREMATGKAHYWDKTAHLGHTVARLVRGLGSKGTALFFWFLIAITPVAMVVVSIFGGRQVEKSSSQKRITVSHRQVQELAQARAIAQNWINVLDVQEKRLSRAIAESADQERKLRQQLSEARQSSIRHPAYERYLVDEIKRLTEKQARLAIIREVPREDIIQRGVNIDGTEATLNAAYSDLVNSLSDGYTVEELTALAREQRAETDSLRRAELLPAREEVRKIKATINQLNAEISSMGKRAKKKLDVIERKIWAVDDEQAIGNYYELLGLLSARDVEFVGGEDEALFAERHRRIREAADELGEYVSLGELQRYLDMRLGILERSLRQVALYARYDDAQSQRINTEAEVVMGNKIIAAIEAARQAILRPSRSIGQGLIEPTMVPLVPAMAP